MSWASGEPLFGVRSVTAGTGSGASSIPGRLHWRLADPSGSSPADAGHWLGELGAYGRLANMVTISLAGTPFRRSWLRLRLPHSSQASSQKLPWPSLLIPIVILRGHWLWVTFGGGLLYRSAPLHSSIHWIRHSGNKVWARRSKSPLERNRFPTLGAWSMATLRNRSTRWFQTSRFRYPSVGGCLWLSFLLLESVTSAGFSASRMVRENSVCSGQSSWQTYGYTVQYTEKCSPDPLWCFGKNPQHGHGHESYHISSYRHIDAWFEKWSLFGFPFADDFRSWGVWDYRLYTYHNEHATCLPWSSPVLPGTASVILPVAPSVHDRMDPCVAETQKRHRTTSGVLGLLPGPTWSFWQVRESCDDWIHSNGTRLCTLETTTHVSDAIWAASHKGGIAPAGTSSHRPANCDAQPTILVLWPVGSVDFRDCSKFQKHRHGASSTKEIQAELPLRQNTATFLWLSS